MKTQTVESEATTFKACKLTHIFLLALLLAACSSAPSATPTSPVTPQPPRVEELTFQSGSFNLVGDLRLPAGSGPFPLVIFVHGSGPNDRIASGIYLPIMKRMQQTGYATFAWDKPGTGESTGTFTQEILKHQRAKILLEAIEVMKARPDIDVRQIGLWGASQAGYVMPRIFSESEDIAFMICVSCAGMSGVDQMAFQVTALALCSEVPAEQAAEKERLLAELDQARAYETYEEYLLYRETIAALARIVSAPIGEWPVLSETAWQTNDPEIENWWNPMGVIEQVRFPVLAIYGDQDRQIDPQQGSIAYRRALELAGNPKSRVELFAGANHAILVSESGCPKDQLEQLEQYVKSLGFASLQEAQEAFLANPDDPRMLEAYPFALGYLDLIEEWLRNLRDNR